VRNIFTRRAALRLCAASSVLPAIAIPANANYVSSKDGYDYEVMKTDAEWRSQLGEHAFNIMRLGHTEVEGSDPKWDQTSDGIYSCRGCELPLYESKWKTQIEKKWLFYSHGIPNSLLMGVDWPEGSKMMAEFSALTGIEVHCRRCGSHMGHVVFADKRLLHCINGAALDFTPTQS
jgi:peptide-methionine (R)-S-oxide reductase